MNLSRKNFLFIKVFLRFVKIVGTYASLHGIFNLVRFEALYNTNPIEIDTKTTLLSLLINKKKYFFF